MNIITLRDTLNTIIDRVGSCEVETGHEELLFDEEMDKHFTEEELENLGLFTNNDCWTLYV